MPEPIKAVLIGAGQRGAKDYGPYALHHPENLQFVAVAEPNPERRHQFSQEHRITPENQYSSWEDLLDRPQMGQAALICTQDQMHTQPTMAALRAGYHVLLEKPMATSEDECRLLIQSANEMGRQLHICHVLRYTKHFQMIRELVQSDSLGQIVHVDHKENVSWWHMAHSYVRGNWASEAESCPMILAKCCHDFDILMWILGRRCTRLNSIGNLIHFRPENAPKGAPERCLDDCPASDHCPFFAPFIYLDLLPLWRTIASTSTGLAKWVASAYLRFPSLIKVKSRFIPLLRQVTDYRGWPRSVLSIDPTPQNLHKALMRGPYGRCVYRSKNDVVDHQVVVMEFEGGISVTLTMQGHSHIEGRTTRIEGSLADLEASFSLGGSWISISHHRSGQVTRYNTSADILSGHSGGDEGLMDAFIASLREERIESARTIAKEALDSHLVAFAAEDARITKHTIPIRY